MKASAKRALDTGDSTDYVLAADWDEPPPVISMDSGMNHVSLGELASKLCFEVP